MARLSISCLGPLQVTLDEEPVTDFKSNKVRALLAYLAVESDRPHPRAVLAGLLWADWPDRDALSNLRYALSNLRRVICDHMAEPPYLLITRDTLQFNPASNYRLDVTAFAAQTEPARLMERDDPIQSSVEEAIALYRGDFLEGFSIRDSVAFEEWALTKRQQINQQLLAAIRYLATVYEHHGQYEQAQAWARRLIELEPWDEAAHQQLMRALALSGHRSMALAQYETCSRLLTEELGVEPAQETTRLYEQIRIGELKEPGFPTTAPAGLTVSIPKFLDEVMPPVEIPIFVAREPELAQLEEALDLTLTGHGRVALVTGEAGSGKTALAQEFTRRAQANHSELIVASGYCNAHTGIGDPYLPFREILGLLTGDVEARWAAGSITTEHARRLWRKLPVAALALVEAGPDLIDTFVPRVPLIERARSCAPERADWLTRLLGLVERKPITSPDALSLPQSDLFEQFTRAVQAMAQQGPLVLVLDDLQWADMGSISLLFHLGRRLAGSRILVVGAYRPEEVTIGRDGDRHPLAFVVSEFQRTFGDITVNLGQAEGRDFIEALLDSEPNRLEVPFREMLYQQTHGHPLFTVELLRGLQQRGDLVHDPDGRWIEGQALNWQTLPARVEAVIAERIARLAPPLRDALRVASVQGELFTAEVVARVQTADEREIVERLSGELDRRHRLVRVQAIERLGSRRVSRYRFRNYLFQKYLYDSLDDVERAYLHEDVGNVLEELHQQQAADIEAIAPQLAWHFQEAGRVKKAVHYLHLAGVRAVQLSAYEEGKAHLTKGLELLSALPDSSERAAQELALQLSLALALMGQIPDREWENALNRARELCHQIGETSQLSRVLGGLSIFHYVRAEYQEAREFAEEALSLAQQAGDPLLVAMGHWQLGFTSFGLGEYMKAHAHLGWVISFYEPQQHHQPFLLLRGSDFGSGALAYDACCLWCLGYPEQALERTQEALTLARQLDHAFSLADVLCHGGCQFNEMRRDAPTLRQQAEELVQLSKGMGFSSFLGTATCYWGDALAKSGEIQDGTAQIRHGMEIRQAVGARCYLSRILGALAEAQMRAGQPEAGLATLDEALEFVEETSERHWESELHRLRAEVLLLRGNESEAEADLQKAIEVARRQDARTWELRATTSLARLWQKQGRKEEARQVLGQIYGWFTEGFDERDLKEASALLEELS